MSIQKTWEKALRNTEIARARVQELSSFADTQIPYIVLSESSVNIGDTVVRKGAVAVRQPAIYLPPNIPQFEGFEFDSSEGSGGDDVMNFLLVRGVTLPSLKYDNKTSSLGMYEGGLGAATTHYLEYLQRREDVATGLVIGPDDCWQFSVLIFVCSQVAKNAAADIRRLMDQYKKKGS